MKMISRFGVIVVLISFLIAPLHAGAAAISLDEAVLEGAVAPATIHTGQDGRVYVVDEGANSFWRIQPADGSYEQYFPVGNGLVDVVSDGAGKIWWTDGAYSFGVFNTNTPVVGLSAWEIPPDQWENRPNLGPLIILNGQVWLATWTSTSFGLYRFSPGTRQLCHYAIPGGSYATSLVVQGGRLWWLNWNPMTVDGLVSLLPGEESGELVTYTIGHNIGADAGMVANSSFLAWAEDTDDGRVVRFDPATEKMTRFWLPSGEHPVRVTGFGDKIWYTDHTGALGRIDPKSAEGSTAQLTPSEPWTVPATCQLLPEPSVLNGQPIAGAHPLTWTASEGSSSLLGPGLEEIDLPPNSTPLGITTVGSSLWVTDPGRKSLVRLEVILGNKVFIPLLRK